jgi:hypothetical protein
MDREAALAVTLAFTIASASLLDGPESRPRDVGPDVPLGPIPPALGATGAGGTAVATTTVIVPGFPLPYRPAGPLPVYIYGPEGDWDDFGYGVLDRRDPRV